MRHTLTLYTYTWSRFKCLTVQRERGERKRKERRKWVAMSSAKAKMKCSNSLPTDQLFNNVFVNLSFVVRGEWTTLAPRTILNRFSIIFYDEKVYFMDWIWWSGWSLTFDAIENRTNSRIYGRKENFPPSLSNASKLNQTKMAKIWYQVINFGVVDGIRRHHINFFCPSRQRCSFDTSRLCCESFTLNNNENKKTISARHHHPNTYIISIHLL